MQTGVATVVSRISGLHRAVESLPAVRLAEVRVGGGRLEGLADGVVVRDGESGRLMSFDKQDRQASRLRVRLLRVGPTFGRTMFWWLDHGALWGGSGFIHYLKGHAVACL
jgi:hypothetical protein